MDPSTDQFPSSRSFYVPGNFVQEGSLASGSGAVQLIQAQVGDTLALSVHAGSAEDETQISYAVKEADGAVISTVQAADGYDVKFPQMQIFQVQGPGVCAQNAVDTASPTTWPSNFGDPQYMVVAADFVYFVPTSGSTLFRVDAETMTQVQELAVDSSFSSGFTDPTEQYIYLVPDSSGYAFKRVSTSDFDVGGLIQTATLSYTSYMGGFVAGEYAYAFPGIWSQGVISRVDTLLFGTVSELDLKAVDGRLRDFSGGYYFEEWGYLVPYQDNSNAPSDKVVRFKLASFTTADVEVLQLSASAGFITGFEDGRYGYLMGSSSGDLVRFRLDIFGEEQTLSLSSDLSNAVSGSLKVGNYAYIFAEDGRVVHVDLATFNIYDVFDVNTGSSGPRPAVLVGDKVIVKDASVGPSFGRICQDWMHRQHTLREQCLQEASLYIMTEPQANDYSSFTSIFTDDMYIYFFRQSYGLFRSELLLDSTSALPSQMMTLPAAVLDSSYFGGIVDGNYGYLLPSLNHATVVRFRLETFTFVDSLDLKGAYEGEPSTVMNNWWGGFVHGGHGYLLPNWDGIFPQFQLDDFSTVVLLDLTTVDTDLRTFRKGVLNGDHVYLVPHDVPDTGLGSCKVARVNLEGSFDASSVTVWNIDGWASDGEGGTYCGGTSQGFSDGFTDGTYMYMLPGSSGTHLARFSFVDFGSTAAGNPAAVAWVVLTTSSYDGLAGFPGATSAYLVQKWSSHLGKLDMASATLTGSVDISQVDSSAYSFYAATSSLSDVLLVSDMDYTKLYRVCQDYVSPGFCSGVSSKTIAYSNSDYTGLTSAFADDTYIYLIPHQRSVLFRYDLQNTVSFVDLPTSQAYKGGFVHGSYSYLVPASGNGLLLRVDLNEWHPSWVQSTDLSLVSGNLRSFFGGFHDDSYGYLVPAEYGVVARFQLGSSFGDIMALDVTAIDSDLRKFRNGFSDGTWGYLVPYQTQSNQASGKVVRFDLATFSTVEVLDVAAQNADAKEFNDGFHDGTFGYLVPASTGIIARFPLSTFLASEVTYLDVSATGVSYLTGNSRVHSGFMVSDMGKLIEFSLGQFSASTVKADLETQLYDMVMVQGRFYAMPSTNFNEFIRICMDEQPYVQSERTACLEGQDFQNYSDVLPMSVTSVGGVFSDDLYLYTLPMSFMEVHRMDLATFQVYGYLDLSTLGLAGAGFSAGLSDGAFGYMLPGYSGSNVVRFDLATFSLPAPAVLDLSQVDSNLRSFSGGFQGGGKIFLVPEETGYFVEMSADFSSGSVRYLDLTLIDAALANLKPGFVELAGAFAFLASKADASYQNTGKIVKIDLGSFSVDSVLDLEAVSSQYVAFSATFSENSGNSGFVICTSTPKLIQYALDTMTFTAEKDFSEHSFTGFAYGSHDGTYGYLVSDSSPKIVQFDWGQQLFAVVDASATFPSMYGFSSFAMSGSDLYLGSSSEYRTFYRKCSQELTLQTSTSTVTATSSTGTGETLTSTSTTVSSTSTATVTLSSTSTATVTLSSTSTATVTLSSTSTAVRLSDFNDTFNDTNESDSDWRTSVTATTTFTTTFTTSTTSTTFVANRTYLSIGLFDAAGDGWNGARFVLRNFSRRFVNVSFIMRSSSPSGWSGASYRLRRDDPRRPERTWTGTLADGFFFQEDVIADTRSGDFLELEITPGNWSNISWAILDDEGFTIAEANEWSPFEQRFPHGLRVPVPGEVKRTGTLARGAEKVIQIPVEPGDRMSFSVMPPMVLEPYYDELYFRQLYTDGALTGGQVNQTAALEISWFLSMSGSAADAIIASTSVVADSPEWFGWFPANQVFTIPGGDIAVDQCSKGLLDNAHNIFDVNEDIPQLLGAHPSGLFTDDVAHYIISEDSAIVVRREIAPTSAFSSVDLHQGGLFEGFRAGFATSQHAVLVPWNSSRLAAFHLSNIENLTALNLADSDSGLSDFTSGFASEDWVFL
ncbi:unnamed protein product, partial [Symbiodinium natans]